MYIVYIHIKGLADYLDFTPDYNQFGFDGYGCQKKEGQCFCEAFNAVNTDRYAYMYWCR